MTTTGQKVILRPHLEHLLNVRYPRTICPSEVPRALSTAELNACGVSEWRDLMPQVREVLWEMRENGEVEILQRGQVIPDEVELKDVKGPIRARRPSGSEGLVKPT